MNILSEKEVRLNDEQGQCSPLCAWCLFEQGIPAGEGFTWDMQEACRRIFDSMERKEEWKKY